MALLFRLPSPFSLLAPSHKNSTITKNPIQVTLISETPLRRISSIPLPASPNRRCHAIRSLCSKGESSDFRRLGEKPPPNDRIFIKGLSQSTSEGYVRKAFSCFGTVSKVKIITETFSKQSLGFAYVWFACEEDAQLAVKEMDGKFVDGRFICVTIAKPESPSSRVRVTPYKF